MWAVEIPMVGICVRFGFPIEDLKNRSFFCMIELLVELIKKVLRLGPKVPFIATFPDGNWGLIHSNFAVKYRLLICVQIVLKLKISMNCLNRRVN